MERFYIGMKLDPVGLCRHAQVRRQDIYAMTSRMVIDCGKLKQDTKILRKWESSKTRISI